MFGRTISQVAGYRAKDLYNQPEVTEAQAAANRARAAELSAKGLRHTFTKPLRPRPARPGVFPVGRSQFYKLVDDGTLPKPTCTLGSTPIWSSEVVHQALRAFGLPVPGESAAKTETEEAATHSAV
jgi:hypothetical protein